MEGKTPPLAITVLSEVPFESIQLLEISSPLLFVTDIKATVLSAMGALGSAPSTFVG